MTITKAIEVLETMRREHGDVEVLFDCQYCGKSTKPDKLEAMLVVSGERK